MNFLPTGQPPPPTHGLPVLPTPAPSAAPHSTSSATPSNNANNPKAGTRIYRACIHCRQRKSKCELDAVGQPGIPPCRRCVREQRECILAGSRRGGRRPKKPQTDPSGAPTSNPFPSQASSKEERDISPTLNGDGGEEFSPSWQSTWSGTPRESTQSYHTIGANHTTAQSAVDNTIASADVLNPSDALEILAQVAGDAQVDRSNSINSDGSAGGQRRLSSPERTYVREAMLMSFPPLNTGSMSVPMIHNLFGRYYQNYHPYFPIAPIETFDPSNLASVASNQPHLFAAILTIASVDNTPNAKVHQECLAHTRSLISDLVYGAEGDTQAVEALLILAEWSTWQHRLEVKSGKSQEDRSAWMLVGTAVRLGYLLGLDQCGFRREDDASPPPEFLRGRLVWSACYMADRQISIRVGRGFWSRGPGPSSNFQDKDFPGLHARNPEMDDYASIFKANLELTQLFSNAHDVLYSNRAREMKLILAGDYVKYIDDFRASIRGWHAVYGTLTCSSRLKVSLLLTYDYLRLYVNAFAFQATFSRLASADRHSFTHKSVATLPDARFIYESIDAAKSLLTTLNNFVDPEQCLRFLPLRFYLYIVHGTVFLYKALATGSMSNEEKEGVRRMVVETILRLRKSNTEPAHIGTRYARLISLLWRRSPRRATNASLVEGATNGAVGANGQPAQVPVDAEGNLNQTATDSLEVTNGDFSLNTFSWLDLDSVGNFATANSEASPSFADIGQAVDGQNGVVFGMQPIDSQQWFNDRPQDLVF